MNAATHAETDQQVFEMLKDFPPVVKASAELRERVAEKFRAQLKKHQ